MTDRELTRTLKTLNTGDTVDITIRYQVRNLDGIESTFGFVSGRTTHALFVENILERVQSIVKVEA